MTTLNEKVEKEIGIMQSKINSLEAKLGKLELLKDLLKEALQNCEVKDANGISDWNYPYDSPLRCARCQSFYKAIEESKTDDST